MGKALGIGLGLYGAAGVLAMAWTAHRGSSGQPHWQGVTEDAGVSLLAGVVIWPYVVYVNATMPAISAVPTPQPVAA